MNRAKDLDTVAPDDQVLEFSKAMEGVVNKGEGRC